MVTVPVVSWATGVEEKVDVKVPVLDVHELLGHLHCKLGLVTPPEKVEQYWQHSKNCNVPMQRGFLETTTMCLSAFMGTSAIWARIRIR